MPTLYSSLRSRHRPTVQRPRAVTMAAAHPSLRAFLANSVVKKRGGRVLVIGAGFAGLGGDFFQSVHSPRAQQQLRALGAEGARGGSTEPARSAGN